MTFRGLEMTILKFHDFSRFSMTVGTLHLYWPSDSLSWTALCFTSHGQVWEVCSVFILRQWDKLTSNERTMTRCLFWIERAPPQLLLLCSWSLSWCTVAPIHYPRIFPSPWFLTTPFRTHLRFSCPYGRIWRWFRPCCRSAPPAPSSFPPCISQFARPWSPGPNSARCLFHPFSKLASVQGLKAGGEASTLPLQSSYTGYVDRLSCRSPLSAVSYSIQIIPAL